MVASCLCLGPSSGGQAHLDDRDRHMVSSNELRDCRGIRGPLRCQCHTHSPVSGRAVEPVILIRGAVYSAQMPFRDFNSSYCANSSMPADWNRSRDFAFSRLWLPLRAGHRRKLALCSALNPGARHLHGGSVHCIVHAFRPRSACGGSGRVPLLRETLCVHEMAVLHYYPAGLHSTAHSIGRGYAAVPMHATPHQIDRWIAPTRRTPGT